MLLVIDVGNTNIVLGLFQGKTLKKSWRIQTFVGRTSDEYGVLLRSLVEGAKIDPSEIKDMIICSVVPTVGGVMERMCEDYFGHRPLQVGPGLKTGIPVLYDNPREVGADRIVNAVAAYEVYGYAGVVVDFGTATTFDAIGAKGEYLGGAIAPGIRIGAEALFRRASKLPRVDVTAPSTVIGKNTVHSMQAGLFFGYVGLVDEIVTRMRAEIGGKTFAIATGGLAVLITPESKTIEKYEENLTLEGLRLLYERNRRRPKKGGSA